jgi:tripartite-type tricarboxylate transporter receptor subunit TctC
MFSKIGFKRFLTAVVAAGTAAFLSPQGAQAEWPEKPIKIVVGFAAGGGTDTYARVLASLIHEELDTPMVVINKPGAAGMIALEFVANEKPDGYTVTMQSVGETVAKDINGESPVDFRKSFRPLGTLGVVPAILVTPIDGQYKTARDFFEKAKQNAGSLRWAHAGRGGLLHMYGDKAFKGIPVDVKDVPFAGGAPTRAAVVAAQVDVGIVNIQQFTGFDTKLRVLGVFDEERNADFPDLPTFKEQGFDVPSIISPFGIYIRSDAPDDIVVKIQTAVKAVTEKEAYQTLIKKAGLAISYRDEAASQKMVDAMYANLSK